MNRHPIVFVHGLLGWGSDKMAGLPYFGMAGVSALLARLATLSPRGSRTLFPSVGPISSNHDRACELFYQLKGGDVHYGLAHANEHGHAETIKDWAKGVRAQYLQWNADRPLHFVGQAQGASTARVLQQLLAQGDFFLNPATGAPYPTSAAWIKSITTISALHNGTPTAYILGCSPHTGRIQRHSTAEYMLRTLVESSTVRSLFGLNLGQWTDLGAFQNGKDNAAYDLSIHGAQDTAGILDHASTYYFSYVTSKAAPGVNLGFRYIAEELSRFAGPLFDLKWPIEDYRPWHENDGLAPVYSQEAPKWGQPRRIERPSGAGPFHPGVWNVMETLDMDHMEPVALPHFSLTLRDQRRQLRLYSRICRVAMSLD